MKVRSFNGFLVFLTMAACIDPISFDIPPAADLLVVDGLISDEPGSYKVKLSRGVDLDVATGIEAPVSGASITLYEDGASSEDFVEVSPGEYVTGGVITGRIGHSYHITIATADGRTFVSDPEEIVAGGSVSAIRYEYEERTSIKSFGPVRADVYNVFIDADAPTEAPGEVYFRWRYTGTYRIETRPELHQTFSQGFWYRTPYQCSGYVVMPQEGGGRLEQVEPCVCCTCWVKQYETKPQLSDTQLVTDGKFSNMKVGEVPVNPATFFDKFLIEVEQMSLSRTAFDFFKLMRTQKEGAADLFQPAPGRLIGNIRATNSNFPVVGLFWATSVRRESVYIMRNEIPIVLPPYEIYPEPCQTVFQYSSTTKPASWND
jgi:hypothetical protein